MLLLDYSIAMSTVCHLATLTDKEILVELLVAIKKVGTCATIDSFLEQVKDVTPLCNLKLH